MNNKLILIVEDEEDILELLEYTLQKEGYETIGFLTIDKNVKKVLDEEKIDLILMDRNLPGIEGTEFINEIKKQGYSNPVIYVTAKDNDEDIIEGFDSYADDYITKPFNLKELCARIKAVIKRSSKEVDILKLIPGQYTITYENKEGRFLKVKPLDVPVTFYPTRVEDVVTLSKESDYYIYNQRGKLEIKGNGTSINVTNLPLGVYYLCVNGNVESFFKK